MRIKEQERHLTLQEHDDDDYYDDDDDNDVVLKHRDPITHSLSAISQKIGFLSF